MWIMCEHLTNNTGDSTVDSEKSFRAHTIPTTQRVVSPQISTATHPEKTALNVHKMNFSTNPHC